MQLLRSWMNGYEGRRPDEKGPAPGGGGGGGCMGPYGPHAPPGKAGYPLASAPYPGRVRVCAEAASDSLIYFHPPHPRLPLSNSLHGTPGWGGPHEVIVGPLGAREGKKPKKRREGSRGF
uniref:Uncharacterized protein n=1 Tax=Morchella brunnea TaxID=1174671 RepID=A0A8K1MHC8_9PEZI|nr:hypothetical protein LK370_mgp074 [Morchella brunnea]UBU98566.1 hypothetical protein [Morchella brunnea]